MDFSEKLINSTEIFNGNIMQIRKDKVLLPDGNTAFREICRHNGGVCILAIDDTGKCAVVKQYRHAVGGEIIELPAGKLEAGENDTGVAAARELEEETGASAGRLIHLGSIYSSPGFCTEVIHIYLASRIKIGKPHPDSTEFLNSEWIPYQTLKEMIADGRILDAKTISAVALAEIKSWRKLINE